MKKGDIITGKVERIDFPNKGIVECGEGTVVVKNVLKGQTVSCRIQKKRKGKAEGVCIEVLEKAPDEIKPLCPHFGLCGGCTYQHLPYEKQLALKGEQVKKLLDQVYISRNQEPSYTFEGIKGSPKREAYRNKMEFSFGDEYKDGPLSLGMHKRGSFYDVVTVEECRIVDADFRAILKTVKELFARMEVPFYHRMSQQGYLRHLLVRKAVHTGEILVALITSSQGNYDLSVLRDELCKLGDSLQGKIVGILHTVNDSVADVVKNEGTEILYGQDYFYEELLGLKFKITEFSFFQTNSLGAKLLYETAREFVMSTEKPEEPVIFDLYSGTGTIAQMLAPVAKKVIGVEIVEEAVEAAKKNAELNGLHNTEFIAGDVLTVIDEIAEKPDLIILDPPRDGIHPKALPKIIAYGARHILYISCKPTSLARDLVVFEENGYHMERAVAVDMFPSTVHTETIALLTKFND